MRGSASPVGCSWGLKFSFIMWIGGGEERRGGGRAGAETVAVRSVIVASVETLQRGSDHSICIQFVAKFLLWGNRPNVTKGDTCGRNFDDAAPCQPVDI